MPNKNAILFSGSAYNIRFSLQSLMDNVVIPNDADVFVLTTRYCLRRKTKSTEPIPDVDVDGEAWAAKNKTTERDLTPLTDAELQLIRDTFGERLKGLWVQEDIPGYNGYLHGERLRMEKTIEGYQKESLTLNQPVAKSGSINSIVDQYRHAWKLYQLMQQYEQSAGVKYEWIMRARIDFIAPFVFNMRHYYENHDEAYLYDLHGFSPNDPYWFEEYCWFSKRKIADLIFPALNEIGFLTDRKYKTVSGGRDHRFAAEVQCGILIHKLNLQDKIIPVRIWRSCRYTNGGDGYDYFNYEFRREYPISLDHEYSLVCNCKTDINQLIPVLVRYAQEVNHITEFGIRFANSSVGLLYAIKGTNKKYVAYDVTHEARQDYLKMMAEENNLNFELILQNPSPEEEGAVSNIEETDMLFIDTNHHARQASHELKLHADRVRRYLVFHDVETFGYGETGGQGGEPGLWYAINPFLEAHKGEWKIREHLKNNNGLLVLERVTT